MIGLLIIAGMHISQAQLSFSQENLAKFKNTKTYIVLEGNIFSEFNANIKNAAEKYWKITPYEIISQYQFNQMRTTASGCSYLTLVDGTYTLGKSSLKVNLLTLVLGDKSGKIDNMREVISIPLGTYNEDDECESYGYKLAGIIKAMQYMLDTLDHSNISTNDLKIFMRTHRRSLQEQTLLLTTNNVASNINTPAKLKEVYHSKFSFTDEEHIEEAINKDEHKAFVHSVGKPGNWSFFVVISCADGKILYGNFRQSKDAKNVGLTTDDFAIIDLP